MSTHPRPTNTADLKHYIDGMANLLEAATDALANHHATEDSLLAFMRGYVGAAQSDLTTDTK